MQEEVNQKTVALSIRTTKLTGKVLAAALGKVARAVQKHHRKALTPQGRQSGQPSAPSIISTAMHCAATRAHAPSSCTTRYLRLPMTNQAVITR